MKKRFLRIAVFIGTLFLLQSLFVLFYFLIEKRHSTENETPVLYERLSGTEFAPDLLLEGSGSLLHLSNHHGQFVILHFWATWCEPCREELPALLSASRALGARYNIKLLAVSNETNDKILQFFDGKVPQEIVRDPSGEGLKRYGVSTLPDTYLLDPTGTMILRFSGPRNWNSQSLRSLLENEIKNYIKQ